jgi:arylsulfatase A-like enzyme
LVIVAVCVCACWPPGDESPPGVLLITVDTLRADKLSSYGYGLETSPNLDALAARGARFTDAMVQWPKTWPSMASLMTGAHPKTTGLRLRPRYLPSSLLMLSEVFGQAGFDSAAVVANFNVGRTHGFDQGFDHFVESWQERWAEDARGRKYVNTAGRVKAYTNATLVTDQALRWLRARDESKPFFLWLHYMDPHGPYVPPESYAELFQGRHASGTIPPAKLPSYQRQLRGRRLITDLGFYRAQYDREIRYFDDELGRLIEALAELGLGQTLIAVTADHGESLGEHDYYLEHGLLSYQPTAHVPLILVQPGRIEAGLVLERPIGLIDLAPTLVELAGVPVPPSHEGVSVAGLLRGEVGAAAPDRVFMEAGYQPGASQLSVRDGRWKLIHVRSAAERTLMTGAEYELYDLQTDPAELTNRAAANPEIVLRLSRELAQWYGDGGAPTELGREIDRGALDERSRDMLNALGYLDTEDDGAANDE